MFSSCVQFEKNLVEELLSIFQLEANTEFEPDQPNWPVCLVWLTSATVHHFLANKTDISLKQRNFYYSNTFY